MQEQIRAIANVGQQAAYIIRRQQEAIAQVVEPMIRMQETIREATIVYQSVFKQFNAQFSVLGSLMVKISLSDHVETFSKQSRTIVDPDNPDSNRTVVVVPFEAGIVKKIFELYTSGAYSMGGIAKKIREDYKIKMYKSKAEKIIHNPFYMGMMKNRDKLYPHIYPTLISKEVYGMATDIRTGRSRKKKKGKLQGKHGIYCGLICCADCGCSFTPTPRKKNQKNGNVHEWVYYYYTNSKQKHEKKPPGIEEKALTKLFADLYKQMKVPKKDLYRMTARLKESHEGKVNYTKELFDTYTNEIKKRDTRLDAIYIDKIDGSITTEQYSKFRANWTKQKEEYEAKLARISKADKEYYITASYLLELASRSYELFLGSEPEQKMQIIALTLQNLTLKDGNLCYDWVKPFDSIFVSAKSHKWGG